MEIDAAAAAVGVAGVCNLAETELGEREVVAGRERETRQAAGLAVARRSRRTSDATGQRPACVEGRMRQHRRLKALRHRESRLYEQGPAEEAEEEWLLLVDP
jgi:hypothetical protein